MRKLCALIVVLFTPLGTLLAACSITQTRGAAQLGTTLAASTSMTANIGAVGDFVAIYAWCTVGCTGISVTMGGQTAALAIQGVNGPGDGVTHTGQPNIFYIQSAAAAGNQTITMNTADGTKVQLAYRDFQPSTGCQYNLHLTAGPALGGPGGTANTPSITPSSGDLVLNFTAVSEHVESVGTPWTCTVDPNTNVCAYDTTRNEDAYILNSNGTAAANNMGLTHPTDYWEAVMAAFTGGQVTGGQVQSFYIAANGSDSNNGTSKTTPWQHAPGMPNCTGTCGGHVPAAGDQFIFRGGDTWHYSSGAPVGLPWNWTWSGSNGNPIYIGVDKTWFSGSSWARPILTMDNPRSTVLVSSCTYDDTNNYAVSIQNDSYVTFDNFEFTGLCQQTASSTALFQIQGSTHLLVENNYFHGWSAAIGSQDQHELIRGSCATKATFNEFAYNVFDGSDSFHGTTNATNQCAGAQAGVAPPCSMGFAMYCDTYNVHHSIFRYLSNGIVGTNISTIHDNLFEYMWISYDGQTHPNVVESVGNVAGAPYYFYNNVIRHTNQVVTYWPQFDQAGYEFNNVFFDLGTISNASNNCFLQSPASSSSTPVAYIYNNTVDGPCGVILAGGNSTTPAWNGTANFENNHFIGYGSALPSVWTCQTSTGALCTVNDNGHDILQSELAANAQGYTPSNNYQPTSGGATIGAGANLTNVCAIFSLDSSLCSGTTMGVIEQAGSGGYVAISPAIPTVPRPSSGAWDAGAYLYSSGQASRPNPPTGLTATVN
jgi:hypothetical protein